VIKIAVVEENATIREGLRILINETEGYICAAAYPHYELLINNNKKLGANVLLIDIGASGIHGVNAIKKIKKSNPDLSILILTLYEENDIIFDALCAGASGYLVKRTPPEKLLQAIQEAYLGGTPMSSVIAGKVINYFQQKKPISSKENQALLSGYEKDILNKLVEGDSFKAISDSLLMSIEDIRFSFKNIYKKLHLQAQTK
jgi:DNA-binding NarL/FixJ family response regulator